MSDTPHPTTSLPASKRSKVGQTSFLSLKADLESYKHDQTTRSTDKTAGPSKLSRTFLDTTTSSSKDKRGRSERGKNKHEKRSTSSWTNTPSLQLDDIRVNLQRKARIYDRLTRGLHAGLEEEDVMDGVVDWQEKARVYAETRDARSSSFVSGRSSEDDDNDDDERGRGKEVVEYIDEFGRTRLSKIKDIPRHLLPVSLGGHLEDEARPDGEGEDVAIYGPSTSFPIYQPPSPVLAQRKAKIDNEAQQQKHFDADWEVRQRGAAFYRFASDEEERKRQMQGLQALRRQTETNRHQDADGTPPRNQDTGREKRKRTIETRKEQVQRERIKVLGRQAIHRRDEEIRQRRFDFLLLPPT